jgi:hypothetical protein
MAYRPRPWRSMPMASRRQCGSGGVNRGIVDDDMEDPHADALLLTTRESLIAALLTAGEYG